MTSDLRKGMNESLFRLLNERLEQRAVGSRESAFEIVCECAKEECTARINVPIAQYEAARSDATSFIVVPGHVDASVERVTAATDEYEIVEKVGEAAVVAEVENPRDG
jgi:hypothetical protein